MGMRGQKKSGKIGQPEMDISIGLFITGIFS
jgi:hypothetical protein